MTAEVFELREDCRPDGVPLVPVRKPRPRSGNTDGVLTMHSHELEPEIQNSRPFKKYDEALSYLRVCHRVQTPRPFVFHPLHDIRVGVRLPC